MKEIHEVVIRDLGREKERYQRKRSDIFVSYLDKIGKSGADFASLYVHIPVNSTTDSGHAVQWRKGATLVREL